MDSIKLVVVMKYSILFFSVCMIACSNSKKTQSPTNLMGSIYDSQKLYYNTTLTQNQDFTGLLNFSSGGRSLLYKKNKVNIESVDSCIIFEGFNPGWGKYVGFLITESQSWFYTKSTTSEWLFNEIDINSPDIEQETGIPAKLIRTIITWDTAYINTLKKHVGNIVHDGYSFWGSKVENIKPKPLIYNYTFYQYPKDQ